MGLSLFLAHNISLSVRNGWFYFYFIINSFIFTIHHYSRLFAVVIRVLELFVTICDYSSLFATIPSSYSGFITIRDYSPLFATIRHYSPLFAVFGRNSGVIISHSFSC